MHVHERGPPRSHQEEMRARVKAHMMPLTWSTRCWTSCTLYEAPRFWLGCPVVSGLPDVAPAFQPGIYAGVAAWRLREATQIGRRGNHGNGIASKAWRHAVGRIKTNDRAASPTNSNCPKARGVCARRGVRCTHCRSTPISCLFSACLFGGRTSTLDRQRVLVTTSTDRQF